MSNKSVKPSFQQSVANACPKCGCQVHDTFGQGWKIHDTKKCNGIVSRSKMEKTFYCRRRNCKYHHGVKNGNVLCSLLNPDLFKDEDSRLCCNSYCS